MIIYHIHYISNTCVYMLHIARVSPGYWLDNVFVWQYIVYCYLLYLCVTSREVSQAVGWIIFLYDNKVYTFYVS